MPSLIDAYLPQIKTFEGFSPRAVWDYKQYTNGYGTRARHPGEVIDRDEAERRLQAEIGSAGERVNQFAPNAPDGVKAALTSLTYNSGDKWQRSGLGAAVLAGNYDEAKDRFRQYNKAGGQTLPGLVDRRNSEASWFDGTTTSTLPSQSEPPMAGLFNLGAGLARARPQPEDVPAMMPVARGMLDAPSGGMGWVDSLNAKLKASSESPLFQFGANMAGAGTQGLGIGGGVAAGAQGLQRGSEANLRRKALEREQQQNEARDAFMATLSDPNNPLAKNLSPEVMATLRGLPPDMAASLLPKLIAGNGEFSKTGHVFQNPETGHYEMVQVGERGGVKRTDLGKMTPSKGTFVVGDQVLDEATGQPIRNVAENLKSAERAKEVGQGQGKQEVAAPGDVAAADRALDIIKQIKSDPNKGWGTGFSSYGNFIRGTPGYDFQNKVNQARSGAFLTAIQQMRGLGSLSNSEGQTATDAVTRMETATSEKAFDAALADYEAVVTKGRATAQARMGAAPLATQPPPSPTPPPGWKIERLP